MKAALLAELNAERAARRPVLLVTDMAGGEQRLVKAADIARDPFGDELEKHLRMNKSGMVESGGRQYFITVHAPTARLVITGAVHVSQVLAPMAQALEYEVTVVDPRTAFASPERFPNIPLIAEWPDVALPPLNIDRYTAFVALTHDPKIDDPALVQALKSDCFYIGALGSRRNTAARKQRLALFDLSPAEIDRLHGPVGLDLGSKTPAEIAVSIAAEIVAVKNGIALVQMKQGSAQPSSAGACAAPR